MLRRTIGYIIAIQLAISSQAFAAVQSFGIDSTHTTIRFKAHFLGLVNVEDRFAKVAGTLDYDADDVSKTRVEFHVDPASIDFVEIMPNAAMWTSKTISVEFEITWHRAKTSVLQGFPWVRCLVTVQHAPDWNLAPAPVRRSWARASNHPQRSVAAAAPVHRPAVTDPNPFAPT